MRRVVKRFHPPGTSPGTITGAAPRAAGEVRASLLTYSTESIGERSVGSLRGVRQSLPEGTRGWLRIVGHDAALLAQLTPELGVHPLVVEDALNIGQRAKVEEHDDYLFVVVDVPRLREESLENEQISLLLFQGLLVTIEERSSDFFKLVEQRLHLGQGKIRRLGVDYLAYCLVDAAVDHFFPVLDRLGEELERLEGALLDGQSDEVLHRMHVLKRDLLRLRKDAWPLREVASALARIDSPLMDSGNRIWLRDVHDHAVQIIDIIETFRELTAGLVDLHLSSVSNRLNQIMKVLTVITTIFIPLSFIAGIYGMNFAHMPELQWRLGYPTILAVMALVAGGMLVFFRRKKWF